MTTKCTNCIFNFENSCTKSVKGYPLVQHFCRHHVERSKPPMVSVPVVHTPPPPKVDDYNAPVHLKQWLDKKKKDLLFYYIYLP